MINKIRAGLNGWEFKLLSYAERVELIRSTLSYSHLFWATVFVLPKSVLEALDRCIRDFFWNAWTSETYFHPLSSDAICRPTSLGGVGTKSVDHLSEAVGMRQVWIALWKSNTCSNLWVRDKYL